jgi:putative ABC transport system permease protein
MPEWTEYLRARLASLSLSPAREAEIIEELSQHLDQRYEELRAGGMSEADARRLGVEELLDRDALANHMRSLRQARVSPVITPGVPTGLLRDLRQTIRFLRSQARFTFVIVLTLGLAIGFNVVLFTILNALLLRPIPFDRPHELVAFSNFSPGEFSERQPQSFAAAATFQRWNLALRSQNETRMLWGYRATSNLFTLIGARAALGRTFNPGEDKVGAAPVVVLSHHLWQRISGDPNIVGQAITLDNKPYTVIGVMPESFWFIYRDTAMWFPMQVSQEELKRGVDGWLIARLKPGVTISQAQVEMNVIAQRLQRESPIANATERRIELQPLAYAVRSMYGPTVVVLQVAVGLVLLMACANVANLLLVRASARRGEFAVRVALGATRGHLLRQVLLESLVLSVAGATLGLFLASNGLAIVQSKLPVDLVRFFRFSQTETLAVDVRVLLFTMALCVITTIAFGLVPALRASRANVVSSLKEASRGTGTGRSRHALARILVMTEMAMSMALLVGAGAMVKSLLAIQSKDLGFRVENVLRVTAELDAERYAETPQRLRVFQQIAERLRALPGVQKVGVLTQPFAVSGSPTPGGRQLEIAPSRDGRDSGRAARVRVDGTYFEVMRIPLKRGRLFGNQDTAESTPVTLLSQSVADRLWPNEDPIGKRVRSVPANASVRPPWLSVVGVVGDVHHPLGTEPQPFLYTPDVQDANTSSARTFVVRTAGDPDGLASAARAAVREVDADVPVGTGSMDVSSFAAQNQFVTALLLAFTALALILAAVGVYGVMYYWVAERVREIGVRMALGATRLDTVMLVAGTGARLALIGAAFGLFAGVALSRTLANQVRGVSAPDPLVIALVAVVLVGTATLACFVPTLRATRIDPATALRSE